MSMVDSIVNSVLGTASLVESGIFSGLSYSQSKKTEKFNEDWTKHQYEYTAQDMQNAGLNPLQAVGAGAGASSVSQTNTDDSLSGAMTALIGDVINAEIAHENNKVQERIANNQLTEKALVDGSNIRRNNALINLYAGQLGLVNENTAYRQGEKNAYMYHDSDTGQWMPLPNITLPGASTFGFSAGPGGISMNGIPTNLIGDTVTFAGDKINNLLNKDDKSDPSYLANWNEKDLKIYYEDSISTQKQFKSFEEFLKALKDDPKKYRLINK